MGLGAGVAIATIYLTFFGTAGGVATAALLVATGALIWFASVEPYRLVTADRRPRPLLFALAGLAVAPILASAVVLATTTLLLLLAVALSALVVGLTRAVRFALAPGLPPQVDDR